MSTLKHSSNHIQSAIPVWANQRVFSPLVCPNRVILVSFQTPFPLLFYLVRGSIERVKRAYANIMLWESDLNVVFSENSVYFKPNRRRYPVSLLDQVLNPEPQMENKRTLAEIIKKHIGRWLP
jgi:hypothetical protein